MKKVKRIFAVLLLTIVIILVGYLNYTGSRLHGETEQNNTEGNYYVEENYKY